jgi:hypothetical protein
LTEQRSDANPPDVRIRTWERLHGLRLPSDRAHPILDVIAVSMRLTLTQVHDEQCARAAQAAAKVGTRGQLGPRVLAITPCKEGRSGSGVTERRHRIDQVQTAGLLRGAVKRSAARAYDGAMRRVGAIGHGPPYNVR